ncbi:MAG: TonB-dependent receptor [Rhodothermaceae bacterium]|nr:TonB-dependent receptor [Rhodothermaceae bacterium]
MHGQLRRSLAASLILLLMIGAGGTGNLVARPSGPTGKIAGRVLEAGTNQGLPGVNVILEGTVIGGVTDTDGYYYILNIPPGTYSVRASFVGFATVTTQNVRVVQDQTTTVNFELREEAILGEEIVVVAERPIVEMDRTTTTAVIDAEQLEVLPVTNVRDAINLQAGVVDGHFRGGRTGEVTYLVNGVPITNAFSKDAAFEIEQNMVESLEVISGVFNAEYGQATSGVVNIVTKDVPDQWSGSLLAYAGAIASNRELEFVGRTTEPGSSLSAADFKPDTVSYRDAASLPNLLDVQASLGGPLIRNRLGIQATIRYLQDNSHFIGRNLFAPSDSSQNLNTGLPREAWIIDSSGDGAFVPRNNTERVSVNATLGYAITPRFNVDYNVFFQSGTFRPYNHNLKYIPDGINTVHFLNQTHILGLHYTIGSSAFANLSYSYLHDKTEVYLFQSPFDERYVSSDFSFLQGANAFAVGGNDLSTSDQLTATHTVVADYSHQLNRVHLMKVGMQARLHTLDNRDFGIERSFRTGNLPQPSPDQFADNSLNAKPVEFSAYVQDKMEFTGLIVNAGLRFDYFDPDYLSPLDWGQGELEEIPDPDNPENSISNREPAKVDMQLSPRLGVAFPISETGVMRFSAGLFFQIPSFGLLYTNPEYEVNPASLSNSFGNPGINPERTLSFEVGLQQGFTRRIGMEITIFSKDVRNLTGQEIARTPQGDFIIRWINRDYGTIRGLTFSLFQRPGGILSWTIDYTLQFAEGTSSSPGEAFGRQQAGLDEILSLVRLDWDRRHVLNNTITVEPVTGLSVTFINRLQSGTPYTTVREFIRSSKKNNATKPSIFGTDVRIYYRIPGLKANLQLFLQAQNLFDTVQEVGVYEDTGRADESVTLELFRRTGAQVGGLNSLDEFYYRQENFGAPRKVSVGLNYRF